LLLDQQAPRELQSSERVPELRESSERALELVARPASSKLQRASELVARPASSERSGELLSLLLGQQAPSSKLQSSELRESSKAPRELPESSRELRESSEKAPREL
jgi:hypothetical protein